MGHRPLEMGAADSRNALLLHPRYHIKFGRSRSNRLGIGSVIAKYLGGARFRPWDRGVVDSLEICFSSTMCYHAKFGHSRSNYTSVIMEIRQKILPFKVTKGHMNRYSLIGYVQGWKNLGF